MSASSTAIGLTTLPRSVGLDQAIEVMERDGGVIIEDFIDAETLEGFWSDLGPALEVQGFGEDGFVGNRTRRVSSLFARSRHSATVALQPHYHGLAKHYLANPRSVWIGGESTEITPTMQISATQAIQIWPGQNAQGLHRDDFVHLTTHPGPENRVQLMLALSDFTAENGGTLVIPGSHKWDDRRMPLEEEAVPTVMAAGSAMIYFGSTYHGGGKNESDTHRTGLSFAFNSGNLRQEENQYLAVPRETARQYPEEIQRLLGYETCPPFCGWFEMNDPMVLLSDQDAELPTLNLLGSDS